jgi:uncharacterized membrane protein YcjF (UPF0283 family)
MVIRLRDWFRGYDEAPARIRFLRVVFAFSTLAFIISLFGPAILSGAVIGFWMFQDWALTYAGFAYIVVIIVTFMIAIVSGIPTLWYEWKRMRQSKERKTKKEGRKEIEILCTHTKKLQHDYRFLVIQTSLSL